MSNDALDITPATAASITAGFRIGEAYRWYIVWLLFVVYVLNFVDVRS